MISGQEVMAGGGGAQEKIWVEVSGRAVTQAGQGHGLSCSGEARSAVRFGQGEGGEGDERRGSQGLGQGPGHTDGCQESGFLFEEQEALVASCTSSWVFMRAWQVLTLLMVRSYSYSTA